VSAGTPSTAADIRSVFIGVPSTGDVPPDSLVVTLLTVVAERPAVVAPDRVEGPSGPAAGLLTDAPALLPPQRPDQATEGPAPVSAADTPGPGAVAEIPGFPDPFAPL
jgi:hypothetical protein